MLLLYIYGIQVHLQNVLLSVQQIMKRLTDSVLIIDVPIVQFVLIKDVKYVNLNTIFKMMPADKPVLMVIMDRILHGHANHVFKIV